jgi:hypothetical protein
MRCAALSGMLTHAKFHGYPAQKMNCHFILYSSSASTTQLLWPSESSQSWPLTAASHFSSELRKVLRSARAIKTSPSPSYLLKCYKNNVKEGWCSVQIENGVKRSEHHRAPTFSEIGQDSAAAIVYEHVVAEAELGANGCYFHTRVKNVNVRTAPNRRCTHGFERQLFACGVWRADNDFAKVIPPIAVVYCS